MARPPKTHLMFEGTADEAMRFYVDLIPNSVVHQADYYETGENKGKLRHALFCLNGSEFICIDSPIAHDFSFTPSVSIWIDCDSGDELERLYAALSAGGEALMPLGDYGFSTRFGWVSDRFGVSWQLNLA